MKADFLNIVWALFNIEAAQVLWNTPIDSTVFKDVLNNSVSRVLRD